MPKHSGQYSLGKSVSYAVLPGLFPVHKRKSKKTSSKFVRLNRTVNNVQDITLISNDNQCSNIQYSNDYSSCNISCKSNCTSKISNRCSKCNGQGGKACHKSAVFRDFFVRHSKNRHRRIPVTPEPNISNDENGLLLLKDCQCSCFLQNREPVITTAGYQTKPTAVKCESCSRNIHCHRCQLTSLFLNKKRFLLDNNGYNSKSCSCYCRYCSKRDMEKKAKKSSSVVNYTTDDPSNSTGMNPSTPQNNGYSTAATISSSYYTPRLDRTFFSLFSDFDESFEKTPPTRKTPFDKVRLRTPLSLRRQTKQSPVKVLSFVQFASDVEQTPRSIYSKSSRLRVPHSSHHNNNNNSFNTGTGTCLLAFFQTFFRVFSGYC
uniref:DUF4801 domain-containing protein n=1 Tax=Syphacia muris TaxID=451379 RepID=A0A0N5ATH2_9BILA